MAALNKALRRPLLVIALAATLVGCTVGPDYVRPAAEVPVAWRVDYPQAAEFANLRWWQQFQDPALDELIETALRRNYDIRKIGRAHV